MNDLAQVFYDIVRKKYNQMVSSGLSSEHFFCQGQLGMILNEMDKARNEALANRTTRQILDDFYDSSQKEFLVEHMNHLKKPEKEIP